jgi:hypothetical protein
VTGQIPALALCFDRPMAGSPCVYKGLGGGLTHRYWSNIHKSLTEDSQSCAPVMVRFRHLNLETL